MSKICNLCGQPVQDTDRFCNTCGSTLNQTPQYNYPPVNAYPPMPVQNDPVVGTGTFFGLNLVFSIPVVGFIVCLIMSFTHNNKNVKNFSRAHLIRYAIVAAITVLTVVVFGSLEAVVDEIYHYI